MCLPLRPERQRGSACHGLFVVPIVRGVNMDYYHCVIVSIHFWSLFFLAYTNNHGITMFFRHGTTFSHDNNSIYHEYTVHLFLTYVFQCT